MSGQQAPQDASLGALTNQCLNMKPAYQYSVKVNELKEKLNNSRKKRSPTKGVVNPPQKPSGSRSSPRFQEDNQKIDNSIRSFRAELDTYHESLNEILDMIKKLHEKFDDLEKKQIAQNGASYADALRTNPAEVPVSSTSEQRLDKLEFQSSENERLNRVLQVTITHPALEANSQNAYRNATHFMEDVMLMEWREIDANMYVQTTRRANTILITFSDQRFKSFLFKARKRLPQQQIPIYINDYLTSYNYKILKLAKEERRRNNESLNPLFETVYSFNGRIFIKKRSSNSSSEDILVKSPENLNEIIRQLSQEVDN